MYNIKVLSNGLKIAYEKLTYARSVSAGVWVLSGSRCERTGGISHFIEHMLFKGTKTKTARQIAETMDLTGGQLNAYTTREYTVYYSVTVADKLKESLELLGDMIKNSVFRESDIELEKNVVTEEIAMYEDSPEDLVFDLLEEHAFLDNGLGKSITGTRESVRSITRDGILEHMGSFYVPSNMVLSVAGNFSEDELLALAEKYFGDIESRPAEIGEIIKPEFHTGENILEKDIEQANLAIGFEGPGCMSELRYPLLVLNNAFGGGMSSRLFQKIREESGLAYSVYTSIATYKDTGIYTVYAGLSDENLEKTREIINLEIERLLSEGLTDAEIERAKEQIRGSVILGGEGVGSHMSALGKGILLTGKVREEEEILKKVESVTGDDVISAAGKIFGSGRSFTQIVKGRTK